MDGQPAARHRHQGKLYDALGYVVEDVSVTDPAGRNETYGYDMTDGGRLISYDNGVDPPNGHRVRRSRILTTVVNQDGDLACMTNDVHGNVLTRTWYPAKRRRPCRAPGRGSPGAVRRLDDVQPGLPVPRRTSRTPRTTATPPTTRPIRSTRLTTS